MLPLAEESAIRTSMANTHTGQRLRQHLCEQVGENRMAALDVAEDAAAEEDTAAGEEAAEPAAAPAMMVRDDGSFRHESLWRGAAVALPVFSLRTDDSVGVGEFEDIRKLVDLCYTAGVTRLHWLLLMICDA